MYCAITTSIGILKHMQNGAWLVQFVGMFTYIQWARREPRAPLELTRWTVHVTVQNYLDYRYNEWSSKSSEGYYLDE